MEILNQPIKDKAGNIIGYASGATQADINTLTPTTPTPVPATPSTVSSSTLTPTTPITYSTPNPVPTYPVGTLDPTVPTPVAAATPLESTANDITARLRTLTDSLVGKSEYQTTQEAAVGLPDLMKTQTDLAAQLKGLQNEAQAIPIQLQNDAVGRGITAGGLAPIQSAQLRDNAVKALTVSTLLEASKGNIANAQAIADKAVAQKYGPIEEQITAAKANLSLILNSPEYTLEEKNRAQVQLDIQNKRQAALDQAKSDAKEISTTAINATQYASSFKATTQYPTVASALSAITNAKSPTEASTIAAMTGLTKPVDLQTQVVELNGRKVLIDTNTGKTIKDLGAAPASSTGTVSERVAAQLQQYASVFVPGARLPDGTPILDNNGYLNPTAFKQAIADYGGSRDDFIKKYGYLLFAPGGVPDSQYGLTAVEKKLITAA